MNTPIILSQSQSHNVAVSLDSQFGIKTREHVPFTPYIKNAFVLWIVLIPNIPPYYYTSNVE